MDGTFTLRIELGNDAMQTGEDVAEALRNVAARLVDLDDLDEYTVSQKIHSKIRDINGSTVGEFTLQGEK